jgi:hypothetical protein
MVLKSNCDLTCREQWGWMFKFFGRGFFVHILIHPQTQFSLLTNFAMGLTAMRIKYTKRLKRVGNCFPVCVKARGRALRDSEESYFHNYVMQFLFYHDCIYSGTQPASEIKFGNTKSCRVT